VTLAVQVLNSRNQILWPRAATKPRHPFTPGGRDSAISCAVEWNERPLSRTRSTVPLLVFVSKRATHRSRHLTVLGSLSLLQIFTK
jgi:hypothetical protein